MNSHLFSLNLILFFKLAREQVGKAIVHGTRPEALVNSHSQPSASPSVVEATPSADNSSLAGPGEPSSPVSVAPVVTTSTNNPQPEMVSGSSASPSAVPQTGTKVEEVEAPGNTITPSDAGVGSDGAAVTDVNTARTPMYLLFFFCSVLYFVFVWWHVIFILFEVNIVGMVPTTFQFNILQVLQMEFQQMIKKYASLIVALMCL